MQFTLPYWLQPHPIKFPELPWSSIVIIILFRAGNFRTHLKAHSVEELNKCDQSVVHPSLLAATAPNQVPTVIAVFIVIFIVVIFFFDVVIIFFFKIVVNSCSFVYKVFIKSLLKRPLTSLFLKNLPAKLAHLGRSLHFELETCERMQQEYILSSRQLKFVLVTDKMPRCQLDIVNSSHNCRSKVLLALSRSPFPSQ